MSKPLRALMLCLWAASAMAADAPAPTETSTTVTAPSNNLDSAQMEKDMQQLNWKQFRFVIESVPKLKADVDAYGPLGWQYVQANYASYGWKKNIDKLDGEQKKELAALIQTAKDSQ